MTFGTRLKQLIEEKQVSQKQLADDLNIALSTLNGYVQDYREPDFDKLTTLATYFSVSADYLIGRSEFVYENKELNIHECELIRLFREHTQSQQYYLLEQAKLYAKYNNKKKDT